MPGGLEQEAAGERDRSPAALALVEAHDDAIPILGTFDCLDDDVGLLRVDQRFQNRDGRSTFADLLGR